ncbi:MAG: hypothetical protein HYT73_01295 [Candidatus Aenigmarchaeota archaeon]|nr:hypothetical protein [Candidatus Aenigmarchaeota archaeon]
MGELKLKVSDNVEKKFREYALKRFGYRKGAFSEAAEIALIKLMSSAEKTAKDRFLKSAGGWRDVDSDSIIKRIYESRKISGRKVEFE